MGVIESRIFDSLGREFPGVRVDLFNENGTRIDTDVTPTQDGRPTTPGRYRFDNLAPGKYTIKAVGRGLDGYNRPDDNSVRDFTIIDDLASIGEAQILAKIQDGTLETQEGALLKANTARDEAKAASRPASWTPTAIEVGARPESWLPTKGDVGLGNVENKSSAVIRSEITKANLTNTGLAPDDIGAETPTGAQAKADVAEAGAKAASRPATWTPSALEVGARPDSWTPSAVEVGADPAGSAAIAEANAKAASRPVSWTPTAIEVGARPDSWTPSKADVGLGNVENKSSSTIRSEITKANVTATGLAAGDVGAETPTGAQSKADAAETNAKSASRPATWMPSATEVGADPAGSAATAEANAKAASRPVTWTPTAGDVGARPDDWVPDAVEVGARPDTWTPTKADVGLGSVENKSSATIRSEITKTNVTATGLAAGDIGAETPAGAQSKANTAETNAKAASRPATWTPTATEVGARPDSWTPTKTDVGLGAVENKSSATIRSEITAANVPLDIDLDRYAGDALSGRVSRIPFQIDARDNGGTGGYHFWKFLEVRLPTSYDGVAITGNLLTGSDDGRQTDHAVLQYTINTGNAPTALSNQKFNLDGEMRSVNGENLLRIYRTFDGTDYTYTFYAYCSNWYGLRGDLEITRSSQAVVKAWQRGTDTGTTVPSGDEILSGNKFADRSLAQADIAAARSNLNVDQVENKSSSTIRSEITKANVTSTGLAAGDIGAETPAGAQTKANTAETNAKAASRPVSWTPSAAEVGARPDSWMPTKTDVGLGSVENKSSATIRSEITKTNVTSTGLAAGDIGAETPPGAQSKASTAETNAKNEITSRGLDASGGFTGTLNGVSATRAYQETSRSVTTTGWYRIALNSGNRAQARFLVHDPTSGRHGSIEFSLGCFYNKASLASFSLLNAGRYSGQTIQKVRLLTNGPYDNMYVEVYLVSPSGTLSVQILDNYQSSGWTIQGLTAGSIPSGYSSTEWTVNPDDVVQPNNKLIKANVTATGLAAGDIGAETPAAAQSKADAAEANAKAASRPISWMPSAAEVGARANTWLPTKSEIGLGSVENKSSATIRSEITKANLTATGLAAGDIGAETPAAAQSKADAAEASAKAASRPVSWTPTAAEVGARPSTWMPNAEDVGARPETWTPTKADIGLGSVENKSSAAIRSEITKSNVTATGLAATDVGAETPAGAETTALSKIAAKVGEDYEIEAFKKGNLINNPSQTSLASAGWTLTHELDPTSNLDGVYSILGGFGVRPGIGQDVEEIEITTERTAVNLSIESHSVRIDANQLYRFFTEYGLGGMNPDSLYDKDYRISFRFFDYNGTELAYRTYNPATKAYTSASLENPVTTWLTPPIMTVWGDLASLGCFLLPANIPVSEIPNVSGNASYHAEIPSGALKVSILFEWILATEEREAFTPVNCDIINGKPSLVATSGGPRPVETVDPAYIAFRSVAYSCWMTGNNYVSVGENFELVLFKYGYQGQTANIYLRLPNAANMSGRILTFRSNGSMGPGSAYLDPDGQVSGQRLNGSTATVTLSLSAYNSYMIRSDGLHWHQVN